MFLCIDVGNSHIYGGVFAGNDIRLRFRLTSKASTSDELGIFLKTVLRENQCSPEAIDSIAICSVVPPIDYSLRAACVKYFGVEPFFLSPKVKTNLDIRYQNPSDVGADRIANAIAACHLWPNTNRIIIDFGTATTFCVVDKHSVYHGGAILPGMRLSVEALSSNTAKLSSVEIIKPDVAIGKTTTSSIQSGVYYAAIGACRALIDEIKREQFSKEPVTIIATGGFAHMFEHENLFDILAPDLVLHGLLQAQLINSL